VDAEAAPLASQLEEVRGGKIVVSPSNTLLPLALLLASCATPALAQDFDPDSKVNTNIGVPVTIPVSSTSEFAKLGTGVVVGAGYNFTPHHAFVGEFMWNWLFPTDESLAPLRLATAKGDLNGHSNLFVLTTNYRFEMRGKRVGGYFIGGVGYYYRNASRTEVVNPAPGTPCTLVWQWWGFTCSSGTVIVNQSRSSFPSGLFGGNAGVGITWSIPNEPRYRMYVEARYHYAPGTPFDLRFIPISTGIRF
jgi:hypothetical protein